MHEDEQEERLVNTGTQPHDCTTMNLVHQGRRTKLTPAVKYNAGKSPSNGQKPDKHYPIFSIRVAEPRGIGQQKTQR